MLNRVWLWAAVGGVAMSAGACAGTMQTTLKCGNPGANDADSLRTVATDQSKHTYGNPGHSRAGPGQIPASRAPHRAVLIFEDNLNATQIGPDAEIVPESRSTKRSYADLAKGQIIGQVWVGASFQADLTDANSLKLPDGTSYIAACVPTGPGNSQPADNTDIEALVIPADPLKPLTSIKGKYHRTRVQPVGGRPWAFWSSSSKSSMCIACGHGWCQF